MNFQEKNKEKKNYKIIWIAIIFITGCATSQNIFPEIPPYKKQLESEQKSKEIILEHKYFTIKYNKAHRLANWVKYTLRKEDLNGPGLRLKKFKPDPILKNRNIQPVVHDDYTKTGYSRGHLVPAEDFSKSQEAIESTFIMSNVIPQNASINSGSWAQLEKQVRIWACGEERITVISGPILNPDLRNFPR